MSAWINVEDKMPEKTGRYLTILKTGARAQHCKTWAGMGDPETALFDKDRHDDGKHPWFCRGTLSVAFWMPLPEFNMKWNPRRDLEVGEWEEPTP
jgi:hypothetical protein